MSFDFRYAAFVMLTCVGLSSMRVESEPLSQLPTPRVEVGGHTAFIKKLAVSQDGSMLLTVAADKTARIWDAASGRLLHVLRVPMLSGHEGQLYAGALSPDGRLAAVGGFTGFGEAGTGTLYLFSTASGRMVTRIRGLPAFSIENIAFAPRGSVLAICFADGGGVMFLDWQGQKLIHGDRSATDKILGADFSSGGDLAITTLDGKLLVYEAASRYARVRTRVLDEGKAPMHVRYSPDGSKLAIGFDRDPVFAVYETSSLESAGSVRLPQTMNQRGLHVVDWSDDGKYIYSGGQSNSANSSPLLRWPVLGNAEPQRVVTAGERISDIRRLPDGAMAFSSGEPEVGVLGADGRLRWRLRGSALSFAADTVDLRASARGDAIEFNGAAAKNTRLRYDAKLRPDQMLARVATSDAGLIPVKRDAAGWSVQILDDGEKLLVNAIDVALQHREQATTWGLAPDAESVLVGTTWFLRRYDKQADLRWSRPLPARAMAVNITADGKLAVVALDDGTFRWHRLGDGAEIMALFVKRNLQDWIAWIPSGYYVSSLSGDNFIGWHVNRGWDRDPDFYRAVQFERVLYRPDLVSRHLLEAGADASAPSRGFGFDIAQLDSIAPPRLQVTPVAPTTDRKQGSVVVEVRGESLGLPMHDWALFVNGVPATPASDRPLIGGEAQTFTRRVTLDLPTRTNRIRVESSNGRSLGFAELDIEVAQTAGPVSGDLYIAAIGVSAFADSAVPQLKYASKDAAEIVRAFSNESIARGFRSIKTWVREDSSAAATAAALEDFPDFLASATGNDTVVVFLASHGISDPKGNYYFVPKDARKVDIDRALKGEDAPSLKRWDFFVNALSRTAGRRLLIVDTCSSGAIGAGFDVHSLAKRSMSSSFALVAASRGDEQSQEYAAVGHGLFTYGLLDALKTGFDPNGDGKVALSEAFEHAFDTVQTLRNRARGTQTPQMAAPDVLADMPLAAVDRVRNARRIPTVLRGDARVRLH